MEIPNPVHIDGHASRGKTYCLYPLIGALRKEGKITLVVASSAFAAKNYPGGRTEHFQYGVPVDENNPFLESAITAKSDRATGAHPSMTDSPLATPDFLNAQNQHGIPPHELKLKVGSVWEFVRNFSGSSQGITKNTRAIFACLHRHSVEVQTLPTIVGRRTVPSLSLRRFGRAGADESTADDLSRPENRLYIQACIHRKQIPLVLSYAVSFNGYQGLTVERLTLDLCRPGFSRGQLYSAMTRVPSSSGVLILKDRR